MACIDSCHAKSEPYPRVITAEKIIDSNPAFLGGVDPCCWMMDEDWAHRLDATHIVLFQAKSGDEPDKGRELYFKNQIIRHSFILALLNIDKNGKGEIRSLHCRNCAELVVDKFSQSQELWKEWTQNGERIDESSFSYSDSFSDMLNSVKGRLADR